MVGQLRPAVHGETSAPGVETDDDVGGKLDAEVGHEVGRRNRPGAENDVPDAGLDVRLRRLLVPDAAADLNRDIGVRLDDVANHAGVPGFAGEGSVQIDNVNAARAGLDPAARHCNGVIGEYRRGVHAPLAQAHALAVLDVDGGNDKHLARVAGIAERAPGGPVTLPWRGY